MLPAADDGPYFVELEGRHVGFRPDACTLGPVALESLRTASGRAPGTTPGSELGG